MNISENGLDLIKSFESCKLTAYRDVGGIWTIGFGSTGDMATPGNTITIDQANDILAKEVARTCEGVSHLLKVTVNQNQFDALVSFSFNVGVGALKTSHLLDDINRGDFKSAGDQFSRWDKVSGHPVAGLTRRRKAERDLFLS